MAATIRPIESRSVHQIQSGQVIVDLCSVVKELVENALDAKASAIEVKFDNYGLDRITVQDNGTGIAEANYESIALKHHTSKLSNFDDLSSLQTFGFRGEALSSLCALSTFTLTTAQAHEAPKGRKLEFEVSGKLKSATLVAAQKGTTACVEHIFCRLPVRQKELGKNIKREYGKVIGLLHAYACISSGVKFIVRNSTPKSKPAVVFSTNGNVTTRENIANVYGTKMLAQLVELDLKLEDRSGPGQSGRSDEHHLEVELHGHISKPTYGEGRQTPDRQMCFVNGRPCGLPQLTKTINEVYKSFNATQSPFIFADFRMDTNAYDVNVTPDKRTVFLHDATVLAEKLKAVLTERFDQVDQTVPQSQLNVPRLPAFRQLSIILDDRTDTQGFVKDGSSDDHHKKLFLQSGELACESEGSSDSIDAPGTKVGETSDLVEKRAEQEGPRSEHRYDAVWDTSETISASDRRAVAKNAIDPVRPRRSSPQLATITVGDKVITKMVGTPKPGRTTPQVNLPDNQALRDHEADHVMSLFSQRLRASNPRSRTPDHNEGMDPKPAIHSSPVDHLHGLKAQDSSVDLDIALSEDGARAGEQSRVQALIEVAERSASLTMRERRERQELASQSTSQKDTVTSVVAHLDIDITSLAQLAQDRPSLTPVHRGNEGQRLLEQHTITPTDEEHLSLTIRKTDFAEMRITGQFNMGFIIAVRHGVEGDEARQKDELFIIDQHASDEKYNFERLQAQTTVDNQRLVQSIKLDLTAVEEEIVLENSAALEQNGFVVDTDLSGDKAVGQRCQLTSLPLSKEVTFNEKDFEELIHLLSEAQITSSSTAIPRPSKVRKMFAMRACRSSIMIGRALSHKQMSRVLEHMGTIDKPWNCPHGRPTMRHLISLANIENQLWQEGDGLAEEDLHRVEKDVWHTFLT